MPDSPTLIGTRNAYLSTFTLTHSDTPPKDGDGISGYPQPPRSQSSKQSQLTRLLAAKSPGSLQGRSQGNSDDLTPQEREAMEKAKEQLGSIRNDLYTGADSSKFDASFEAAVKGIKAKLESEGKELTDADIDAIAQDVSQIVVLEGNDPSKIQDLIRLWGNESDFDVNLLSKQQIQDLEQSADALYDQLGGVKGYSKEQFRELVVQEGEQLNSSLRRHYKGGLDKDDIKEVANIVNEAINNRGPSEGIQGALGKYDVAYIESKYGYHM